MHSQLQRLECAEVMFLRGEMGPMASGHSPAARICASRSSSQADETRSLHGSLGAIFFERARSCVLQITRFVACAMFVQCRSCSRRCSSAIVTWTVARRSFFRVRLSRSHVNRWEQAFDFERERWGVGESTADLYRYGSQGHPRLGECGCVNGEEEAR